MPVNQASMALSKFYEDQHKGAMPTSFGHCQGQKTQHPIRLNMVQKGQYWFRQSPLRYRQRDDSIVNGRKITNFISQVCLLIIILSHGDTMFGDVHC